MIRFKIAKQEINTKMHAQYFQVLEQNLKIFCACSDKKNGTSIIDVSYNKD